MRYAPVNAAFSGIRVSIIKRPEGSLMNPSYVGSEGYRKKSVITTCYIFRNDQ